MEVIKKTIRQIVTSGTTVPCTNRNPETGELISCTGTCYTITGDTGASYSIKILLTQLTEDIGFLDAYTLEGEFNYIIANNKFYSYLTGGTSLGDLDMTLSTGKISGTTNDAQYSGYTGVSLTVTGGCTSRLSELLKYGTGTTYFDNGNITNDGVDYINSTGNTIVYYLGGIKFIDISGSTIDTTFSFITTGIRNLNFIDKPIYKNPAKENIISNPKINDDVFIVRQETSAFENNYRLEYVKNLNELLTYAGGKYFNIINNV